MKEPNSKTSASPCRSRMASSPSSGNRCRTPQSHHSHLPSGKTLALQLEKSEPDSGMEAPRPTSSAFIGQRRHAERGDGERTLTQRSCRHARDGHDPETCRARNRRLRALARGWRHSPHQANSARQPASGDDWIGLRANGATASRTSNRNAAAAWLALLLVLGSLLFAWRMESR